MASQPHIRLAQGEDIAALHEVNPIARAEPGRRHFIANAVAAGQCWAAAEVDDASALLGYGVLNDAFFEQDFVPLLMVRDSARRRGIAAALLHTLEQQGRGASFSPPPTVPTHRCSACSPSWASSPAAALTTWTRASPSWSSSSSAPAPRAPNQAGNAPQAVRTIRTSTAP